MIAIIAFTKIGCQLGKQLATELDASLYVPERFVQEFSAQCYGNLSQWTGRQFGQKNDMIFVSATGIAVRSISPFVKDKLSDPAVVAVDEQGKFAVPLLSGHVGGANALAGQVAKLTGGVAVISTATDLNHRFAVDVWATQNQMLLAERDMIRVISGAVLEGEPVGFSSQYPVEGPLPGEISFPEAQVGICVCDNMEEKPFPQTLHLIPKNLVLGIGCRRGTSEASIGQAVEQVLTEYGLDKRRICRVASIDLKKDEAGLQRFCSANGWQDVYFSALELEQVPGEFPHSDFVQEITGVDNVCQRAVACLGARVIVPKQRGNGITVAVGELPVVIRFDK